MGTQLAKGTASQPASQGGGGGTGGGYTAAVKKLLLILPLKSLSGLLCCTRTHSIEMTAIQLFAYPSKHCQSTRPYMSLKHEHNLTEQRMMSGVTLCGEPTLHIHSTIFITPLFLPVRYITLAFF